MNANLFFNIARTATPQPVGGYWPSPSNRRFNLSPSEAAHYWQRISFPRLAALTFLALFLPGLDHAACAADKLRFAVGPLQPTPNETKKSYDPFFKHLAEQLGVDYTLEATTDWAGIAVALSSGQVDVAWMGPWGYVIAHNQGAGDVIATAKYDGKPIYHAIIIARPDLETDVRYRFHRAGAALEHA